IVVGLSKRFAQFCGPVFPAEDPAQHPVQRRIVQRIEWMRHDYVRHEAREFVDRGFFVLIYVHDEVGRGKFANPFDVHALGAADFRHRPYPAVGMDAKTGAAHQTVANAEIEQQFGDAGNQTDDARICPRWTVRSSDGVDRTGRICLHVLVGDYTRSPWDNPWPHLRFGERFFTAVALFAAEGSPGAADNGMTLSFNVRSTKLDLLCRMPGIR